MKAELVRPGWKQNSQDMNRGEGGDVSKEGDQIDLDRAKMKVALVRPGWYVEVIQKDDQ